MTTVYDVVTAAGFSGSAADTMVGIVLAESGGNAWAYNPNALTGDKSYGLAQINMIGSLGPSREREYGLSSYDDLFDPLTNLKVAYSLSGHGTSFFPWTTYTSGAYHSRVGDRTAQVIYKSEYGSPNTDGGSKLVNVKNPSANLTSADSTKIKPGKWTTYKGKKLRDPIGFASYNASNKSPTGWVTLPSWGYNTESVKLAWQWLWDYYDDGELQSQYPNATRGTPPGMPTNGDVSGLTWTWILNNAVEYGPNAANREVGIPDKGAATGEGYVGDAVKGAIGAAKDAVSWTASLGEILSWLTDKKKRERLAIFMLGALILLVIVLKEFGPDVAPIAAEAALA